MQIYIIAGQHSIAPGSKNYISICLSWSKLLQVHQEKEYALPSNTKVSSKHHWLTPSMSTCSSYQPDREDMNVLA